MPICQVFFHKLDGHAPDAKTRLGGRRKPSFGPYKLDRLLENAAKFHKNLGGGALV
jgi:hypothetical protein